MNVPNFAIKMLNILIVLISASVLPVRSDSPVASAEYLKTAIRDIENINNITPELLISSKNIARPKKRKTTQRPNINTDRSDTLFVDETQPVISHNPAPALSLTKGELLALYDTAVKGGSALNAEGNLHAIEIPDNYGQSTNLHSSDLYKYPNNQNSPGYYYYYYPLKTLLEDHQNDTNYTPQHTVHSHTHLHNVKIEPVNEITGPKYKGLEPLFMAISSFIGMSLMFFFSMLMFPKFGIHKYKSRSDLIKPEVLSLSEIIFEAIEGHDCHERIYCEAGKVLKALHLNDNRFIKFFQRVSPGNVAKSIEKIRQQAQKKRKCVMIQCKRGKEKKENKQSKTNPRPIHLRRPK